MVDSKQTTHEGAPLRHALIVGANSGIGLSVTECLLNDGWYVTATYRSNDERLTALPNQERLTSARIDVSNRDSIRALVDQESERHGPIQAMVYCAGQLRDRPFLLMSPLEWSEVLEINLTGAFHAAQAVVRSMMTEGHGRLVFIGSTSAQIGNPGQANYAASKAGLVGLCRTLAVELATYGVTANLVAAGPIETPMTRGLPARVIDRIVKRIPGHRIGQPDEIGEVVRFLVSSSNYLTGQVVTVDGGLTVS